MDLKKKLKIKIVEYKPQRKRNTGCNIRQQIIENKRGKWCSRIKEVSLQIIIKSITLLV